MAGQKTDSICDRAAEKQRTWKERGKVLSVALRVRRLEILLAAAVGNEVFTGCLGDTTNLFHSHCVTSCF